jgi:dTDP-glucose 4,6-dehydratase
MDSSNSRAKGNMKKILITGTAGFIFSNFIRKVIDIDYEFVSIDKCVQQHNLESIFNHQKHKFYLGDIADMHFVSNVFKLEKPDYVIHGAAESFVDDAIKNALSFTYSNVLGTQNMVDDCLAHNVKKMVYISTDEVYGHLESTLDVPWTEEFFPRPRNPYSATKYAGECIVYAAHETHGLTYNITRTCNNYGPNQPPRNLIPKVITCLRDNMPIPVHGSGSNIREWLYVDDNVDAIMKVLENGKDSEIYNIGSGVELTNMEMIDEISRRMNARPNINYVKNRPGHDYRYSINCDKIKELGWKPNYTFNQGLDKTIQWYLDNTERFK